MRRINNPVEYDSLKRLQSTRLRPEERLSHLKVSYCLSYRFLNNKTLSKRSLTPYDRAE